MERCGVSVHRGVVAIGDESVSRIGVVADYNSAPSLPDHLLLTKTLISLKCVPTADMPRELDVQFARLNNAVAGCSARGAFLLHAADRSFRMREDIVHGRHAQS
jgi:hypothetical protein